MQRSGRQDRRLGHLRQLGHFHGSGHFRLPVHFHHSGHFRQSGHFRCGLGISGCLRERRGRNLRERGRLRGDSDVERRENVGRVAGEPIGELHDHRAIAGLEAGLGGGILHLVLPFLLKHADHLLHDPLQHGLNDLLRRLLGLAQRAEHALELLVARHLHLHLQSRLV